MNKELDPSNLDDKDQNRMCDLCNRYQDTNRNTCEGSRCEVAFEYLQDEKDKESIELKERESNIDYMLLYGIAKLFSMHSTRFIGEMKNKKTAYFFEQSIKYTDKWINCLEINVKSPEAKKMDDLLVDDMSNWIMEFRKNLIEAN